MNFSLKSLAMAGTCAAALMTGTSVMAWGTAYTDQFGRTHYNFGGRYGTSFTDQFGRTHFNGPLFRGMLAKKLFADADFANRIDVAALQTAIETRNVDAMTSSAWDLKGVELILGKKDKTTTSDMLFASAAKLAVEQGNAGALKQIVALAPECKKYEEQLALKGKTRGMTKFKSVTAFPQLTVLPQQNWQAALKGMQSWQQPMLDSYIMPSFRGMSAASGETAAMLINDGRVSGNAQMIALGALELAKYPYDGKLGEKLDPAQIFAEAAELAIAKQDRNALLQIVGLYNSAPFKTEDFAQYLQGELTMLGKTRGLNSNAGQYQPGDFSPLNFQKLLDTVYTEGMTAPAK